MTEERAKPPRIAPSLAIIVSHTHWDREWYLTYSQFRARLIDIVRRVLEQLELEPEYRHFLLDGQSIILEDYLSIRPEDAPRIEALVREGALSLGPWYVLPDEFLVSGEATVRNLLLGHKVAAAYGGVQKVGYMPDSFGHIAQMPQILKRVGIDSFIYTRGSGDELEDLGHEYLWRAPDGSEVLAVNQCGGYCNAGGLGHREEWEAHTQRTVDLGLAVDRIRRLFESMSHMWRGGVFLVNNGCDHFPPQADFAGILTALREEFPDTVFVHGSLSDYVDAVRRGGFVKKSYGGELLKGRYHHILSGVWSARMYLKQQNAYAQTLLGSCVEPVSAYLRFCAGRDYPHGLIESCWKLLLENHPHDSICGCSTDEVHRQMLPRFAGVIETGEQVLRDHLAHLTPTFARKREDDSATTICVLNPLTERRSQIVDRLVVLQPPGVEIEQLRLFDESGQEVPFELVGSWYVDRFWGVDYRTELFGGRQLDLFGTYLDHFADRIERHEDRDGTRDSFLHLRFLAKDLPAVGHAQFFLREGSKGEGRKEGSNVTGASVKVIDNRLENEYVEVMLHPDGTFDVRDKTSGGLFTGLNRLEDTEDVGDEYDYSPAPESRTFTSNGCAGDIRVLDGGGLRGRLQVEYDLELPMAIDPSRERRSDDQVRCRALAVVTLERGSRLVQVELRFDNRAKDHRLRVEFPTGVVAHSVVSDGHFYVSERPLQQPSGEGWRQAPSGTYPQQDFTLVQANGRGLAVLNKGLPEIQATQSPSGEVKLSLTLLRAVGWLSRDDLETRRRQAAGPTLHTPEAQCQGSHNFEYAVLPFPKDYIDADVKGMSERYRTPVVAIQGVLDGHVAGGMSLVQKTSVRTCVTALKRHESRDSLVVRLYNLTSDPVEEDLRFGIDVASAWRLDLLEERIGRLTDNPTRDLALVLGPHEILSLEVEFAR
jgi:alpha-mannosidase